MNPFLIANRERSLTQVSVIYHIYKFEYTTTELIFIEIHINGYLSKKNVQFINDFYKIQTKWLKSRQIKKF